MIRALALAAMMLGAQLVGVQAAWSAEVTQAQTSKAQTPKADTVKGQAIMTQVCAVCHGADGNSAIPANPKLAGQFPEYTQKQLVNFKPGAAGKAAERPSPIMAGFAAPLSNDDIRNVAAYLASQKPGSGAAKNKDAVGIGQRLWRGGDVSKGLAACASCHGATGAGMPAQYPRLAGQHADYTEAQLKAFRTKERSNDAGGMMQGIALKMTDAEIKAVADYIAGLR